jgi:hypothetical protein
VVPAALAGSQSVPTDPLGCQDIASKLQNAGPVSTRRRQYGGKIQITCHDDVIVLARQPTSSVPDQFQVGRLVRADLRPMDGLESRCDK